MREPWIAAAAVYAVLVAAGTRIARTADLVSEAESYAPLLALPSALAVNLLVAAGFVLLAHLLGRLAGASGAALAGATLICWGVLEALSVAHHRVKGGPITLDVMRARGPLIDLDFVTTEDRVACTLLFLCAGLALPALLRTAVLSPLLRRAAHPAVPLALGVTGALLLLTRTAAAVGDDTSALVTLVRSAVAAGPPGW